ncbi:protein nessun dorma-like isoform X2 [Hetaerina americana]|uniref:protein nessun dorma-like isoform X2 n=1 Tax=Hetaerina americana TaxID=62018 RepID=UPI003A7F5539
MAPTVIEFDKTLQERLQEYRDIFSVSAEFDEGYPGSCKNRILGSQVKDFWRNYLSVVLAPRGWRAIWKIPVEKCQLMSLQYPSEILVEVLSTSLETFSAEVKVLSINEKPLPQTRRSAGLIELFPVDFNYELVDPWILADDLDKFRFFFQQIWYPWDETDDSSSWPESYLEKRLNLLYDMVTGEVRAEDAERIRYLVSKSRCIKEEMERAEAAMEECEDVDSAGCDGSQSDLGSSDYSDDIGVISSQLEKLNVPESIGENEAGESEESLLVRMVELQKEMKYIQDEVELLSSSSIRTAMANEKLRRCKQYMHVNSCSPQSENIPKEVSTFSKTVVAVLGKGSMFELKSFLDLIESRYGKGEKYEIEIYPQLQLAKDLVPSKETIFALCAGSHSLKSCEKFLAPGTIVGGISNEMKAVKTTIVGQSLGKVMIIVDWSKFGPLPPNHISVARLENICFDPIGSEAVVLVECGSLSIKQCSFVHASGEHSPKIGLLPTPSTSVLEIYERFGANCKIDEIPPGSKFSMLHLPVTAAFVVPPQRGIAVGAGGFKRL